MVITSGGLAGHLNKNSKNLKNSSIFTKEAKIKNKESNTSKDEEIGSNKQILTEGNQMEFDNESLSKEQ